MNKVNLITACFYLKFNGGSFEPPLIIYNYSHEVPEKMDVCGRMPAHIHFFVILRPKLLAWDEELRIYDYLLLLAGAGRLITSSGYHDEKREGSK